MSTDQRQVHEWRRKLTVLFGEEAAQLLTACEPGHTYWELLAKVAREQLVTEEVTDV